MEVYLLFSWIGESPTIALLYLSLSTVAGFVFMALAKAGLRDIFGRMRGLVDGSERGGRMFLLLGKLWFVGALLLFPGYLTDIAALYLLLFVRGGRDDGRDDGQSKRRSGEGDVVETRGRLLDDE